MLSAFVGQFGGSVGGMVMEEATRESGKEEGMRERRRDDAAKLVDAKGFSRAVIVDGEAKVVKQWGDRGRLRTENRVWRDSGCGNNWAMGYFGESARSVGMKETATGESDNVLVDRAMEVLRREAERLDRCEGCMVYHSLAGGTGSGVGSRLLEEIRDGWKCPLLSISVLPFSVGELPLQYYNSTLCLSRILEETDACLMFSNDELLSIMSRRLAKKTGSVVRPADAAGSLVKTEDLNLYLLFVVSSILIENVASYITAAILGLIFPTLNSSSHGQTWNDWSISKLIAEISTTREAKFVELWSNSHSLEKSSKLRTDVQGMSWTKLSQQLFAEAPRYHTSIAAGSGEALCRIKTCASRLIFRGNTAMNQSSEITATLDDELCRNAEHVSWMAGPRSFVYGSPRSIFKHSTRSITWAASRSSYLPALSHILHRCENMLESKAYLHWYARYGLRTEDMEEAIELLREWLLDASQFFGRWIRVVTKTDKLSEMR